MSSKKAEDSGQPCSISSVALLTADRMEVASRALQSYQANFTAYGKDVDIIVMDDSKADNIRKEYLQSIRHCTSVSTPRYAGLKEKELYIQELDRVGIHLDVARFAILGDFGKMRCTIGANRNAILLDTVGECVFTADDDTVCMLVPHPERKPELQFSPDGNPRDTWFYETRDKLCSAADWVSSDLLGEHERSLGKNLSKLVAIPDQSSINWNKSCAHFAPVHDQGQFRIVATMSGVAGDSGCYAATWLLSTTGRTLRNLIGNEAIYRTACISREVLGVAPAHTITPFPFCMSTTMGLDNRDILPPFLPVGRNEDGLFGIFVNYAMPAALFGHVPLAVFHSAQPGRRYEPFPDFRASDLVASLIMQQSRPSGNDIRSSLRSLGQSLLDMASLPERDFWTMAFKAVSMREGIRLRLIERTMLDIPDCPAFWKNEIQAFRKHIIAQLNTPDYCVPAEFRMLWSRELARAKAMEFIGKTGKLLRDWQDVIDAARLLRTRGIRISSEVMEY